MSRRTHRRHVPALPALLCAAAAGVVAGGGVLESADAYTYGNIVVTRGERIEEYRTDASAVGEVPVPYPGGTRTPEDPLRDVVFDQDARIAVYNGAAHPWLSLYDPGSRVWTHETLSGWSTLTTPGYGSLALSGPTLIATDTGTLDGLENGLLRFDSPNITAKLRFGSGFDFSDVATGPDGRIYALVAGTSLVWIYNPITLDLVSDVLLAAPITAMTVGTNGDIYAVDSDGGIRRFDATGAVVDGFPSGVPLLADIDCSATGELVVGTLLGEVLFTDLELDGVRTFLIGGGAVYVAWVPAHATTPATPTSWGAVKARYRR